MCDRAATVNLVRTVVEAVVVLRIHHEHAVDPGKGRLEGVGVPEVRNRNLCIHCCPARRLGWVAHDGTNRLAVRQ